MDEDGQLMRQIMVDAPAGSIWSMRVAKRKVGAASRLRRSGLGRSSQFDVLAQASLGLQPRGDDGIGILLAAASLPPNITAKSYDGIWAQEAIHRAYSAVRLFLRLHERQTSVDRVTRTIERRLASDLARILYSLRLDHGANVIACASDVRDTARDLVDLFGPAFGDIELDCEIERLALPHDARRALVLLTYELVANSLLHAFAGRDRGWIRVRLGGVCTGSVYLCIEDDGIGLTTETPNQNGVAYMLAHRLGGTLSYTRSISGLTCAHLVFEPAHQVVNQSLK